MVEDIQTPEGGFLSVYLDIHLGFMPLACSRVYHTSISGYRHSAPTILSAVDYVFLWPTLWYTEWRLMVMCSIGNRVGMLSFANLALTVLFASRNNILLWFTNWSRSTFVLVHRWLAVICVIQAGEREPSLDNMLPDVHAQLNEL